MAAAPIFHGMAAAVQSLAGGMASVADAFAAFSSFLRAGI